MRDQFCISHARAIKLCQNTIASTPKTGYRCRQQRLPPLGMTGQPRRFAHPPPSAPATTHTARRNCPRSPPHPHRHSDRQQSAKRLAVNIYLRPTCRRCRSDTAHRIGRLPASRNGGAVRPRRNKSVNSWRTAPSVQWHYPDNQSCFPRSHSRSSSGRHPLPRQRGLLVIHKGNSIPPDWLFRITRFVFF